MLTCLDMFDKQVASMKAIYKTGLALMLLCSFSTSMNTLEAVAKYPELGTWGAR